MEDKYVTQEKPIIYQALWQAKQSDYSVVRTLTDTVGLVPKDFGNHHYEVAWQAMQESYIAAMSGEKNTYSLTDILGRIETNYRTNGHAADASKLMQMWSTRINEIDGNNGNPVSSAKIIKDGKLRDAFKARQDEDAERVRKSQNPATEIAQVAHELLGMAKSGGEQTGSLKDAIIDASKAKPESSGFDWMDKHLFWNRFAGAGGFAPTMNYVISAPSGHGKTSSAATFAASWIHRAFPAVIMSVEESRPNFTVRMLSAFTGYPPHIVIRCVDEINLGVELSREAEKVKQSLEHLEEYLFVYEIGGNVAEMEQIVRRHRVQFGHDMPMLVLIDHIGAMDDGSGNWARALEQSAKAIKTRISNQFSVATLTFTQPSPEMEQQLKAKNYTTTFSGRGSNAILQWADYFVAICRHNSIPNTSVIQGGKNRFGDDSRVDECTGRKLSNWGVLEFDPRLGVMKDNLITDDIRAEMEAYVDSQQ